MYEWKVSSHLWCSGSEGDWQLWVFQWKWENIVWLVTSDCISTLLCCYAVYIFLFLILQMHLFRNLFYTLHTYRILFFLILVLCHTPLLIWRIIYYFSTIITYLFCHNLPFFSYSAVVPYALSYLACQYYYFILFTYLFWESFKVILLRCNPEPLLYFSIRLWWVAPIFHLMGLFVLSLIFIIIVLSTPCISIAILVTNSIIFLYKSICFILSAFVSSPWLHFPTTTVLLASSLFLNVLFSIPSLSNQSC